MIRAPVLVVLVCVAAVTGCGLPLRLDEVSNPTLAAYFNRVEPPLASAPDLFVRLGIGTGEENACRPINGLRAFLNEEEMSQIADGTQRDDVGRCGSPWFEIPLDEADPRMDGVFRVSDGTNEFSMTVANGVGPRGFMLDGFDSSSRTLSFHWEPQTDSLRAHQVSIGLWQEGDAIWPTMSDLDAIMFDAPNLSLFVPESVTGSLRARPGGGAALSIVACSEGTECRADCWINTNYDLTF